MAGAGTACPGCRIDRGVRRRWPQRDAVAVLTRMAYAGRSGGNASREAGSVLTPEAPPCPGGGASGAVRSVQGDRLVAGIW